MPQAAPKICRCGTLVPAGGRCQRCAAEYRKPASNEFYHRGAWRRIADEFRAAARGICQCCGASGARQVDHIVPRSRGGSDEASNLQLLCDACHSRKSALEGSRWRK
jgi:5-methylcytosine-specific restriction endonuclease McrA